KGSWLGVNFESQAYVRNRPRTRNGVARLPAGWARAGADAAFTRELLGVIRRIEGEGACELALERLIAGQADASPVWDAIHLAANECMVRFGSTTALHANTSMNALHYLFRISGDPETRLLLLLQGLGWMCHFISPKEIVAKEKTGSFITEIAETD